MNEDHLEGEKGVQTVWVKLVTHKEYLCRCTMKSSNTTPQSNNGERNKCKYSGAHSRVATLIQPSFQTK